MHLSAFPVCRPDVRNSSGSRIEMILFVWNFKLSWNFILLLLPRFFLFRIFTNFFFTCILSPSPSRVSLHWRTAVRETDSSRHHGCPIQDPMEFLPVTALWYRCVQGGGHYTRTCWNLFPAPMLISFVANPSPFPLDHSYHRKRAIIIYFCTIFSSAIWISVTSCVS